MYGEFSTKRTWYVTPLNQADKKKYGHPTVKPLEIVQNLLVNSSKQGDIVLDPFMGSGTTAVACIRTGRKFIGYELDEGYYAIAQQRIADAVDELLEVEA